MDNIEDIKALVVHYLRGIWKNRWVAIIIAWPLLFVGVVAVDQIKDRYLAETKVYIDTSSILKPLLKGLAIQSDFDAIVRLMIGKLLSRPNLERAARLMDMDIYVNSPKEMETLILKIRDRVDISVKKQTGTYTITYSDENPDTAKRMVQTLLDIFIEDTLGKSINQSDSAILFLDRQIAKYDSLLREAENRREEFKRKNVGLMPNDGANYYSQYQENGGRLEQAKLSLNESLQRHIKIKEQLDKLQLSINTENINRPELIKSSLSGPISSQEVKLQNLLLLYTDQHPDVINAELVLQTLKTREDAEMELLKDEPKVIGPDTSNPLIQELLFLLTQTEADISSFRTRALSLEGKQNALKKLIDVVPQIESELQRLNRDYDVHKGNYNELVQRREQARISDDVESGADQVKFRIIEPPYVSPTPQFPNRPLFDLAVLLAALGIGYGVSLLISLLQPVFYNQTELGALGRAVLGTVSKFDTIEVLAKRRRNLFMFISANALFVTVGIALIYLHSRGILILSTLKLEVMAL
jgi:polysaccharide chain length determinant protein (PEP-CTERM system associated)